MSSFQLNRRMLLCGGTALALSGTAIAAIRHHSKPAVGHDHIRGYRTGALAGRSANDLYGVYVGWNGQGKLPDVIRVDWNARLATMWQGKVTAAHGNPVVGQVAHALVSEYRSQDPGRMTFTEYRTRANSIANKSHQSIAWKTLGKLYLARNGKTNDRKLALLKKVAGSFGGRTLMAYALTELMPGADGAYNRTFLDFLLRNAGRRFVESIPALHDKWTSFGPFQFTSYAVYDTPNDCRGASRVNRALPRELCIPGSVLQLRGDDHLQAAWLFAVHNLAMLIRRLTPKQLSTLERKWSSNRNELAQFVAVAHHAPAGGYAAALRWLDNGTRQPFRVSCSRIYRLYAEKTAANFSALA